MTKRTHHLAAVTALLLASVSNLTALHAAETAAESGFFSMTRTAKPPAIDGKITPGEWDKSLTTSAILAAFDKQQISAATEMSVMFDDSKFYFLFKCGRAPGEWRLSKSVRVNDDYSFGDPSVEVWLAPPKRVPETYQSVINTYPAVLDLQMIPSRGYTAQGWKGNWDIKVTETPSDYTVEASIPIKDFGIDAIKNGDVWRMLLCRSALGAKPRPQGSWALTTAFAEIAQYPQVKMFDDSVAVQVRDVHTLLSGDYRIPITLVGRNKDASAATVEFRFHQKPESGPDDVVEKRPVQLAANARETLTFEGKVPANSIIKAGGKEVTGGHLTVLVQQGDQTIFRQTIPYAVTGWTPAIPVKPEKAADIKPLNLFLRYGPQSNVLMLRADILELPNRTNVAGGTLRILDPNDNNKELRTKQLSPFSESYSDTHLTLDGIEIPVHDYSKLDEQYAEIKRIKEENRDRSSKLKALKGQIEANAKKPNPPVINLDDPALKPLPVPPEPPVTPARKILVEVSVTDASGKVLSTEQQEVSLLRQKFTWQNNNLGITDKPLPGLPAIGVSSDTMTVYNRKLQVDGLGLLKSIDNGGTKQINRMRLVAIKDGKEVTIEPGAPKITRQTEGAVTFTGQGKGAGLTVSSSNTLESDGYVLTDLTIAPEAAPSAIDKLYLEVVMPESEATHFCTTAGGWAAVHDETPKYWTSQQTSSGAMINDFVPYIWLTNTDRAFLWVADNDKGWITENEKKVATQEIIRKDGLVTMRINFVEIPATLDKPTTLRYAYQTFPSRPLPAGWRSWVCSNNIPPGAPGAKIAYFYPNFIGTDWVINWPYYGSPFPHSWARSKTYFDKSADDPRARPTVGAIAHSIGFYRDYEGRQFPSYAVDWGEMPGVLSNNDVTQSRGPNDFRVYYYDQWVRNSGMRAVYIDENYIAMDRNFLTGGAYYRADGRLQPGYTYLGLRDYFKRLKHVLHDAGAQAPNLWQHISSGSAYHAWLGDIFMEGENVGPSDEEFDYIEVLPAARMRAIGSAKVNGGAMLMMCQAMRHATPLKDKHIHQFVGWVQAHDVLPEQVLWHAPIAQAARFYKDDVDFIGYWESRTPVKATTPDAIASLHTTKGRALMWIVNTSRQDRQVDITIDWQKLGLDRAKTIALNAETGLEVPLTNTGLSVTTLKRDFVAVHLIQRDKLAGSQSFAASFDQGTTADEAFGSEMLEGKLELADSDKGKALATINPVTLNSHLNLLNTEGRLKFRALLTDTAGPVLRTTVGGAAKDTALPAPIVLEIVRSKAKEPSQLVLRRDSKTVTDRIAVNAPAAGWHEITLTWRDGKLALAVDGAAAPEALPIDSMNILNDNGPVFSRTARFTFGGPKSPLQAIDDLATFRKAD